jgi:hypothetical protein
MDTSDIKTLEYMISLYIRFHVIQILCTERGSNVVVIQTTHVAGGNNNKKQNGADHSQQLASPPQDGSNSPRCYRNMEITKLYIFTALKMKLTIEKNRYILYIYQTELSTSAPSSDISLFVI